MNLTHTIECILTVITYNEQLIKYRAKSASLLVITIKHGCIWLCLLLVITLIVINISIVIIIIIIIVII